MCMSIKQHSAICDIRNHMSLSNSTHEQYMNQLQPEIYHLFSCKCQPPNDARLSEAIMLSIKVTADELPF